MTKRYSVNFLLPDPAATLALGRVLAFAISQGDFIGLRGPLGAGKTTLARGVIRALQNEAEQDEVVSPTFTLVQTYEAEALIVSHFDLYRIEDEREIIELGFDDALDSGAVLVEWPDHLGSHMPEDRLDIELLIADDARRARLTGRGAWAKRLKELSLSGKLGEWLSD